MRFFKETEAICNLIFGSSNCQCLCVSNEDTSNIKSIKITGVSRDNIDIVGIFPIANIIIR